MDLTQVIPFVVGVVVLLWAAASAAMAFSGGPSSGLHRLAPPPRPALTSAQDSARALRRATRDRILNYALALIVACAFVALVFGTLLA